MTLLEDERLNLDTLTARKDVADGHRARIRHRHGIIKHIQLLVKF